MFPRVPSISSSLYYKTPRCHGMEIWCSWNPVMAWITAVLDWQKLTAIELMKCLKWSFVTFKYKFTTQVSLIVDCPVKNLFGQREKIILNTNFHEWTVNKKWKKTNFKHLHLALPQVSNSFLNHVCNSQQHGLHIKLFSTRDHQGHRCDWPMQQESRCLPSSSWVLGC